MTQFNNYATVYHKIAKVDKNTSLMINDTMHA